MIKMYKDRTEAGTLLANKLKDYSKTGAVVLAIPRGGIPLGYIISEKLNLPLEVVLSKKIGHPLHKEFAIGAVTLSSSILSDAAADISPLYIEQETKTIRSLLKKRYNDYYGARERIQLKDKVLILVDDGIVIGENIYHHYEKGKSPIRAAIDGTLEVIPPIVSAPGDGSPEISRAA